jgi:hypothetical protein
MRFIGLLACLTVLSAQQGHPLVGSWHGTWGSNAKDRRDMTFVLNYDGKAVSGLLNPGADGVKFQKVTLDPSNWTVHFEAETKDHVQVSGDGKLEDITSVRRSITGTWTQGSSKGDFKVTRDD